MTSLAQTLAKKLLEISGFEVGENGWPRVRVADVEWNGLSPRLALDHRGELEISWSSDEDEDWGGGFVNREWQWKKEDGTTGSVAQGGTWIHRGGRDHTGRPAEPGELYPYEGDENGTFSSPRDLAKKWRKAWLVHLLLESLPPGAEMTFELLGEHPSGWTEEVLGAWLVENGVEFDEEEFDDAVEEIWSHLAGTSAMSQREISEAIWDSIQDDESRVWSHVASLIEVSGGAPNEPTFVENDPYAKWGGGHDLVYVRTGWRGDPDLDPEDEDQVLQICREHAPDRYPDDGETGALITDYGSRNGWVYVMVWSGRLAVSH